MGKMSGWLAHPQTKLGAGGLLVLLVVTGLVTPLSLDMYTPAVPHMTEHFDTTESIVNLTLVGYYLFFTIGMLIFGPVSDKHGRKPLLLFGTVTYAAGSAACALAPTIWALIAFRVVQALGAGAVSAVSMAIVKDAIRDDKRELVLSVMQVMFVIGPVLAPVIGAFIVQFASWRVTFWVLAIIGTFCVVLTCLYEETLPEEQRYEGSVLGSILNLKVVLVNKGFMSFLLVVSVFNLPYMAYVSVASYVYITFYGLSEMAYSLFFAIAAVMGAVGPFIWLFVQRFMSAKNFTTVLLSIATFSGVIMLLVGQVAAGLFCFSFLVFAVTESCIRPYSTNILLSQSERDAGAASAMLNFMQNLVGCAGMALAVLPWPNYIVGLGIITIVSMGIALLGWFALLKSKIPLKGIKD